MRYACVIVAALVLVLGLEGLRGWSEDLPAPAVRKVADYDQLAIDNELGRLCDCSKFVNRLEKAEQSIEELAREDDAFERKLADLAAKMDALEASQVATLPVSQGSGCPDGSCPVPAASVPAVVKAAPVVRSPIVDTVPGHWTYPGTIETHLPNDHGVSAAGLSLEEQLTLYDQLHEGTARGFTVSRSVSRGPVYSSAYASCPAGGCPQVSQSTVSRGVSRTVRRSGLFRR